MRWEQREARVRIALWEDPLADAWRFGVELWLLMIVLEGEDGKLNEPSSGLTLWRGCRTSVT